MSFFKVCPRDQVQLTPTRFLGQLIDACPQCDGVWLDEGELEKLLGLEAAWQPGPEATEEENSGVCPVCHLTMQCRYFSAAEKVVVDCCNKCSGVWLDAEELRRILQLRSAQSPHKNG